MMLALVASSVCTAAMAAVLPRISAPRMAAAEMARLRGALDGVLPQLAPRLSALGIDSSSLCGCLNALPADDRDEILLAAAIRCAASASLLIYSLNVLRVTN